MSFTLKFTGVWNGEGKTITIVCTENERILSLSGLFEKPSYTCCVEVKMDNEESFLNGCYVVTGHRHNIIRQIIFEEGIEDYEEERCEEVDKRIIERCFRELCDMEPYEREVLQ